MGLALPQLAPASEDRASGAQVIDGSLKFVDGSSQQLTKTFSSAGNRRTNTFSCWIKRSGVQLENIFSASSGTGTNHNFIRFNSGKIEFYMNETSEGSKVPAVQHRDIGWYHLVFIIDTTNGTADDRMRIYVNSVRLAPPLTTFDTSNNPSENYEGYFGSNVKHTIGSKHNDSQYYDGQMSQVYFIDGQALEPENFGFTDPLTNTWRPKKYEGTFGTNGFYLPFDGNSPIGEDKSGKGNNWTPVNFGGSVALDNPIVSGARPILNTDGGGNVARSGVFGSKENKTFAVTVASVGGGNRYHFDGVDRPNPTLIRGVTYTFDQSDNSNNNHPLRFSTTSNGSHGGGSEYTDGVATNGTPGQAGAYTKITVPHNSADTLYYYCTQHSGMGSSTSQITDETKADKYASNCVFALSLLGKAVDISDQISCVTTAKALDAPNAVASSDTSNFYGGSFYFDGTNDRVTTTSSASSDFTFGTGSFTVEGWFKYDFKDTYDSGFFQISDDNNGSSNYDGTIYLQANGAQNRLYVNVGNDTTGYTPTGSFLDVNGIWHHIAIVGDGGTAVRFYINGISQTLSGGSGSGSYDIDNATHATIGKYYSDANYEFGGYVQDFRVYKGVAKYTSNFVVPATSPDILPDTPSGVSGGSKLAKVTDGAVSFDGSSGTSLTINSAGSMIGTNDFTVEFFIYSKSTDDRRVFSLGQNNGSGSLVIMKDSDGIRVNWEGNGASGGDLNVVNSGWHHVAAVRNSNNLKVYIDGKLDKDYGTVSIDFDSGTLTIGDDSSVGNAELIGIISNLRVVQSALYTANFNPPMEPLTNVTNTKLLCCQSNTSATEGAVKPGSISANGNAAATNFNPFITDINAVRGQETGYSTLNPLDNTGITKLVDGNLSFRRNTNNGRINSTIAASFGKYYAECQVGNDTLVGVSEVSSQTNTYPGGNAGSYGYFQSGQFYDAGSSGSYAATFTTDDYIGCILDLDNGTIAYTKNGVSQGVAKTGLPAGSYRFSSRGGRHDGTETLDRWNFGQKPFKFPPPAGFQPLNAANVRPETVITRPDQYVGVTTYLGTGAAQKIPGLNFQSDLIWVKARDANYNHRLWNSVNGFGSGKALYPDETSSMGTNSSNDGVISTDIDGWTFTTTGARVNDANNYVGWAWKAGGNKNTFNVDDVGYANAAAAGLTGGSITPTGSSVGTKQGFSIIKYNSGGSTGNYTLSHGMGKTPKFIIHKQLTSGNWWVYHASVIDDMKKYLQLNSANAVATNSGNMWGASAPTDSVFGVRVGDLIGTSTDAITYLWADVPGLQKFGTYSGNSNADGPFIELGFRPALFVMKQSDSTGYWMVYDSARDPINDGSPNYLFWNADSAEGTGYDLDFLSNGVKLRTNNANFNTTSYIYAAWAEAPTVNLYGGGANAR